MYNLNVLLFKPKLRLKSNYTIIIPKIHVIRKQPKRHYELGLYKLLSLWKEDKGADQHSVMLYYAMLLGTEDSGIVLTGSLAEVAENFQISWLLCYAFMDKIRKLRVYQH